MAIGSILPSFLTRRKPLCRGPRFVQGVKGLNYVQPLAGRL